MINLPFVKCQGSGNTFILLDLLTVSLEDDFNLQLLVQEVFESVKQNDNVDGVIFITCSACADARMIIFNPDGTRASMCLNGIRCMCKYVYYNYAHKEILYIETDSGIININVNEKDDLYKVNNIDKIQINLLEKQNKKPVLLEDISLKYKFMWVDVYTPYLLALVENQIDENELLEIGRKCNSYKKVFPFGINVSFVKKLNEKSLYVRTYERCGIELSLSCSSSMVAAVCMMVELGECIQNKKITVFNKGGSISCTCYRDSLTNQLLSDLEGNAIFEYSGEIYIDEDLSVKEKRVLLVYDELKKYKNKLIKIKEQCNEANFLIEME